MTCFRFDWVEQYLERKPKVLLDVGTWDGADAIAFKHNWPSARVMAFEACPDNWANILADGVVQAEGVEAFHLAVCDHAGGVEFTSNTDTRGRLNRGQSGSILPPTDQLRRDAPNLVFKAPRAVPSVRLDEFCHQHEIIGIDVLHMDVQGAETLVLRGLGFFRPAMIFLETNETAESGHYEGAGTRMELLELRRAMGYRVAWDSGQDQLWIQ